MIRSQKRVLIVDDDADFLKALQICFTRENFEVVVATDGESAHRILRESGPVDLVVTDFMMPERNGMELVRVMKQDPELFKIPIVVMSNNTNPDHKIRAHEMGASAYLLKPEGARAVAEKAVSMIVRSELPLSTPQTSPVTVQAMRASLLALLRLAATTDGLPAEVRSALISAEKLVESLFAAVPDSEAKAASAA